MKDASYSMENAVARLYEISTTSNLSDQATLFIKNQQIAYDTWIASNGRPDILGQPLHTKGAFEVYVQRIESADFVETGLFEKIVIRAWQGMPLFEGDIIQASPNSIAAIELLIGGRVGIRSGCSIKILSDSLIENQNDQRKGSVWDKFISPTKPLTIPTRGGGGIKG